MSLQMIGNLTGSEKSGESRNRTLDLETCKTRLEEIGSQLKLGKLTEAEADAARLALLSQARTSSWPVGGLAGTLGALAGIFILVAGMGAISTYLRAPAEMAAADDKVSPGPSGSGQDGEMIARLKDYSSSLGKDDAASTPATGKMLPDVNTMIQRLAARLEAAPGDVAGWRTLGWSYFNTGRYEEAAAAFAKAVALDPTSAELKSSYDAAKAKAAGGGDSEAASTMQAGAADGHSGVQAAEPDANTGGAAPLQTDPAIRAMVDGLASRLESAPRDVEGWTRLMRSRVVLGEKDTAVTAFRKALDVFKDDPEASRTITAEANDLGLKAD